MGEKDKLDHIIKQLNDLKGVPDKLNDVIKRVDNLNSEMMEWKLGVEKSLESAHKEIGDLKSKCQRCANQKEFVQLRKDLHNDNLKTRIHSYKQNLIFCGITGAENNKWETETILRNFWVDCLGIPEDIAYAITLLDCHRMKTTSFPANIIAKFAQLTDRSSE
jgi:hypothetical protein